MRLPVPLLIPPHAAAAARPDRGCAAVRRAQAVPACAPMPHPAQLAALGALLCLSRREAGGDLDGWRQAVRAECRCELDSDGLRESIEFHDARGACCWRLCLLPDTDFLAWDELAAGLAPAVPRADGEGVRERLWRRLRVQLRGPRWRAAVLRFHVRRDPGGGTLLAASQPPLSALGLQVAQRLLRGEGIREGLSPPQAAPAFPPASPGDVLPPSPPSRSLP